MSGGMTKLETGKMPKIFFWTFWEIPLLWLFGLAVFSSRVLPHTKKWGKDVKRFFFSGLGGRKENFVPEIGFPHFSRKKERKCSDGI